MSKSAHNFIISAGCLLLLAGSISACSTTVAPEDSATTEYVFQQTKNTDQVLSKDHGCVGNRCKTEED